MTTLKPTPPHNPLRAPATCLCADCSRIVIALRCPVRDEHGNQCGDYRHRGNEHTLITATVFQIASERAVTGEQDHP